MIRNRIKSLIHVKASELIPNEKNWRTHPAKQQAALKGLLSDIGIADAVLVRKVKAGYQLIDGHLRKEVLGGDTMVPALVLDLNDEESDKLLATLDPLAAMAGRNNELLSSLLSSVKTDDAGLQKMLEDMGKSFSIASEDQVDPLPRTTNVKLGQVFQLGTHKLMCGDSTKDVAALLGDERPNLMITDPPYGVNYDPDWRNHVGLGTGHRRTGKVGNDDRSDWTDVWKAFSGDVAYVWHGCLHPEVERSLSVAGFAVRAQIIWAKQHIVISRGGYHWQHEPCWYAVRKGAKADWVGDRKQTTLWSVVTTLDTGDTSGDHSTQKPVELFRRPMLNHTRPGDAVFEPFCGSGSCIVAGEQTGRRVLAMELEPLYVDQSIKRWEKLTGKKAKAIG